MLPHSHRRDFLSTVSLGVGAALLGSRASGAPHSAADMLTAALIGCGGRGVHDAGLFQGMPNTTLAYVCDVDEGRRQAAAKELGVDSDHTVADLRRVLDDPAVDAVLITTPDHWHAIAAILACAAGKHVYVEKPISHNVREGRLLVEAAARNRTLVQHGTQCRSTPMMIEGIKLLTDGKIGEVVAAKAWNVQLRASIGRGENISPPAGLDYDTWVGPATMIPYRTNRVHNRWTWWYHFGTGDMGNDGVHDLDCARWGLGVDRHPTKIVALGGKYVIDDDQEFPDTQQVTFEYTDASAGRRQMLIYEQRLWSTNHPHNADSGVEFYGTQGQLFLSRRGKIELRDEHNKLVELGISPQPQDDIPHMRNFCDAIRQGVALNADALTGHLSTSLCHLGNAAVRVSRALTFDPTKEQIVGDDAANALLHREYREHWARPKTA